MARKIPRLRDDQSCTSMSITCATLDQTTEKQQIEPRRCRLTLLSNLFHKPIYGLYRQRLAHNPAAYIKP